MHRLYLCVCVCAHAHARTGLTHCFVRPRNFYGSITWSEGERESERDMHAIYCGDLWRVNGFLNVRGR